MLIEGRSGEAINRPGLSPLRLLLESIFDGAFLDDGGDDFGLKLRLKYKLVHILHQRSFSSASDSF